MSYSQNDEQRVILDLCAQSGRLLDIGAYDGVTFSNSRALIERGWTGVLVEPSHTPFAALVKLYADRPEIELVNALAGDSWAMVPFHPSDDAVATSDEAHYQKWKRRAKFERQVVAASFPVSAIAGSFDFITVDCEGAPTMTVFKALEAEDFKGASVLCVEKDRNTWRMVNLASARGFGLRHTTSENLIFSR